MTWELWYLLGVIVLAVYFFVTERIPIDITALLITVLLMAAQLVTVKEGLSGFSDQAALAILALLILNTGLERTGVIQTITDKLMTVTGNSGWSVLIVVLPFAAVLSAFTNNTAVITMFLPIMIAMGDRKGISPSKLLMPLAFISILGGLCTLIGTSTNLLVNSIARQYKIEPFGFFEFSRIGGILVVIGIAYCVVIAYRTIPARRRSRDLEEEFGMKPYLTEMTVPEGSVLIDTPTTQDPLFENLDIEIIRITRAKGDQFIPRDHVLIQANDRLLIKGGLNTITQLRAGEMLQSAMVHDDAARAAGSNTELVEAIVAPGSSLVGEYLSSKLMMERFEAVPIAINRTTRKLISDIETMRLRVGDALLLEASKSIHTNDEVKHDLILMNTVAQVASLPKRLVATGIMIGVVAVAALGLVPIVISALAGVVLMVLTGCINTREAYLRVEWKVYFLIAGLIPLGAAIQNTGLDKMIAETFVGLTDGMGNFSIILMLFFFTVLITNVLANNATALLMAPIAISIAHQLEMDPHALLLTVMFGASTAFFTPVGYHTLTLIYAPGKYRFKDYIVAGLPLTIIIGFSASWLIYQMYAK